MKKLIVLSGLVIVTGYCFGQSSSKMPIKIKSETQNQLIIPIEKNSEALKSNTPLNESQTSEIREISNTSSNSSAVQARSIKAPKLYTSIEEMEEAVRKEKENSTNPK